MIIYTVIPYYDNSQEVFLNDVKSFKSFSEAEIYSFYEIDGKSYSIVENKLD